MSMLPIVEQYACLIDAVKIVVKSQGSFQIERQKLRNMTLTTAWTLNIQRVRQHIESLWADPWWVAMTPPEEAYNMRDLTQPGRLPWGLQGYRYWKISSKLVQFQTEGKPAGTNRVVHGSIFCDPIWPINWQTQTQPTATKSRHNPTQPKFAPSPKPIKLITLKTQVVNPY